MPSWINATAASLMMESSLSSQQRHELQGKSLREKQTHMKKYIVTHPSVIQFDHWLHWQRCASKNAEAESVILTPTRSTIKARSWRILCTDLWHFIRQPRNPYSVLLGRFLGVGLSSWSCVCASSCQQQIAARPQTMSLFEIIWRGSWGVLLIWTLLRNRNVGKGIFQVTFPRPPYSDSCKIPASQMSKCYRLHWTKSHMPTWLSDFLVSCRSLSYRLGVKYIIIQIIINIATCLKVAAMWID